MSRPDCGMPDPHQHRPPRTLVVTSGQAPYALLCKRSFQRWHIPPCCWTAHVVVESVARTFPQCPAYKSVWRLAACIMDVAALITYSAGTTPDAATVFMCDGLAASTPGLPG